jgi:hypothetical protein
MLISDERAERVAAARNLIRWGAIVSWMPVTLGAALATMFSTTTAGFLGVGIWCGGVFMQLVIGYLYLRLARISHQPEY